MDQPFLRFITFMQTFKPKLYQLKQLIKGTNLIILNKKYIFPINLALSYKLSYLSASLIKDQYYINLIFIRCNIYHSIFIYTVKKIKYLISMFCGSAPQKVDNQASDDSKKIENYSFKPSCKIGEGNFSQVFQGIDQNTGLPVAIKVVKLASLTTKVAERLLMNEVAIIKQLSHQNVLKCHNVFSSKNNCYIVTDFYEGGDLERLLFKRKYFREQDISQLVYQIYKGLSYLNQRNIIHRDFKPANIFLTSKGCPKISDFGFAVKSSKPFKDINIGSPIYMSPQGLLLHEYGPKTEVWSFGVMIYELLHGETPLSRCKDQKQLKQKILVPVIIKEGLSLDLKKLIQLCLTVDPNSRIQMREIAKTSYMSKLINEYETKKDLSSTSHTLTTLSQSALQFINMIKNYEEGLALLQYCRLVHKTSQQTPSPLFSQWLLNLTWNLKKIKLHTGDAERNENLIKTINDYFTKYRKQHKDSHLNVSCEEIIEQCGRLINKMRGQINSSSNTKLKLNNLNMLLRETEMVRKLSQPNKMVAYSKSSQVEKYLESIKNSKKSPILG